LELDWNRKELASRRGLDAVGAYVQHSGSLSLTHCSFTLHDLGILLDLVRGPLENAERGGLKNLTVSVQVLSPQGLAEKLPQLEKLKVHFAHLRSNEGADDPTWTGEGRAGLGVLKREVQPCFFSLSNLTFLRRTLNNFFLR